MLRWVIVRFGERKNGSDVNCIGYNMDKMKLAFLYQIKLHDARSGGGRAKRVMACLSKI